MFGDRRLGACARDDATNVGDDLGGPLGHIGPGETKHRPPFDLRQVVPVSISLERFLSSVPATAITLDDQSMVRVREIDAAIDRAEPLGSHLAEWWWEAGFPQE